MKFKTLEDTEDALESEKEQSSNSITEKKKKKKKEAKKIQREGQKILNEKMVPTLLPANRASCIPVEEMEKIFKTDLKKGLTEDEAKRRRKIYGSNDFDVGEDLPLWKKYLNQVNKMLTNISLICYYFFWFTRCFSYYYFSIQFSLLYLKYGYMDSLIAIYILSIHLYIQYLRFTSFVPAYCCQMGFRLSCKAYLKKDFFQFKEPMIILLLASGLVSVIMGQYDDAVSITVVCTSFPSSSHYLQFFDALLSDES